MTSPAYRFPLPSGADDFQIRNKYWLSYDGLYSTITIDNTSLIYMYYAIGLAQFQVPFSEETDMTSQWGYTYVRFGGRNLVGVLPLGTDFAGWGSTGSGGGATKSLSIGAMNFPTGQAYSFWPSNAQDCFSWELPGAVPRQQAWRVEQGAFMASNIANDTIDQDTGAYNRRYIPTPGAGSGASYLLSLGAPSVATGDTAKPDHAGFFQFYGGAHVQWPYCNGYVFEEPEQPVDFPSGVILRFKDLANYILVSPMPRGGTLIRFVVAGARLEKIIPPNLPAPLPTSFYTGNMAFGVHTQPPAPVSYYVSRAMGLIDARWGGPVPPPTQTHPWGGIDRAPYQGQGAFAITAPYMFLMESHPFFAAAWGNRLFIAEDSYAGAAPATGDLDVIEIPKGWDPGGTRAGFALSQYDYMPFDFNYGYGAVNLQQMIGTLTIPDNSPYNSLLPPSAGQQPPLRLSQRDDGLGLAPTPRLPVAQQSQSVQSGYAPRVSERSRYL